MTALPHSEGETLFRMLKKLASMEKGTKVDIQFTTRSLPYGYGRNFGFNRVIKVSNLVNMKNCDVMNIRFSFFACIQRFPLYIYYVVGGKAIVECSGHAPR